MMKKILVVILFSVFCVNAFSQNVVKEYWENGNLKFERKNVRIDSIYIYFFNFLFYFFPFALQNLFFPQFYAILLFYIFVVACFIIRRTKNERY